jgi:hypothetical protein
MFNIYGHKSFDKLNKELLKITYLKYAKSRIIDVDGTQLNIPLKLKKDGYKVSNNKNYTTAYLTLLIDSENKFHYLKR